MMLFETRADSFGDSIKDLLQPIDDPMVRPSSTFLVLPHLAAYELLVDATREQRPIPPSGSPASSGIESVSISAHHPAAPSPFKGACCKRPQCHHVGAQFGPDRGNVLPPRSRLYVTNGPCEWPWSEMMFVNTVAERPTSMVNHVKQISRSNQCNLPCD